MKKIENQLLNSRSLLQRVVIACTYILPSRLSVPQAEVHAQFWKKVFVHDVTKTTNIFNMLPLKKFVAWVWNVKP